MSNWGEEIILDSHRIPWLIWIQLLILLLLILLLSYLGLFSMDFAVSGAAVSSPPSKIPSAGGVQEVLGGSQETQAEGARGRENPTEGGRESTTERNGFSGKDWQRLFHPCHYLELAKKAFLQCLGLGNPPQNSRGRTSDE